MSSDAVYKLSEVPTSGTFCVHTRLWKTWFPGSLDHPLWSREAVPGDGLRTEVNRVLEAYVPRVDFWLRLFSLPLTAFVAYLVLSRDWRTFVTLVWFPLFLQATGYYTAEVMLEKVYQQDVHPKLQTIAEKYEHQLVVQNDYYGLRKLHCGSPEHFTESYLLLDPQRAGGNV